jgi:transcription antitermination factor NusG
LKTFVIRTASRREWSAADKLRPFVDEVIMPLEWRAVDPHKGISKGRRQAGEVCAKALALFPGYLFLKCAAAPDFHRIGALKHPDGSKIVSGWLSEPGKHTPAVLTPVQTLMLKSVLPTFPDKLRRLGNERFRPGQKVRAIDGPFAGLVLTVEHDAGKKHVETIARILGHMTPVKMPVELLRAA